MEPLQWVRLPPEQSSWYTWWIVMKSCALIDTALILVLRSNFIDSVVSAIGLDSQLDTVWSLNIFGKERILQFIQFCYQFADRLTKSFASYEKNNRLHLTHVPITPICLARVQLPYDALPTNSPCFQDIPLSWGELLAILFLLSRYLLMISHQDWAQVVARRYQPDIIVHCVDPEPNQITVLKLLNIV